MKKIISMLFVCALISTPAFANWFLVWDANPASDNVASYNVYFNTTVSGTTTLPEYNIGATVPVGCWSVSAVNDIEMEGIKSDPLCRDVPGKANGLRLEKRK